MWAGIGSSRPGLGDCARPDGLRGDCVCEGRAVVPRTAIDRTMRLEELGRHAAYRLLASIDGQHSGGVEKLPCRLVIRGSTGTPRPATSTEPGSGPLDQLGTQPAVARGSAAQLHSAGSSSSTTLARAVAGPSARP